MPSVLWEADPFIEAAEDLQESVDRLLESFGRWYKEQAGRQDDCEANEDGTQAVSSPSAANPLDSNVDSLLHMCDSVRLQVSDFHKAVSAMTRNPEQFHISEEELARRFEFVKELSSVEKAVRHALLTGQWDGVDEPGRGERALEKLLGGQQLAAGSSGRDAAAGLQPEGAKEPLIQPPPREDAAAGSGAGPAEKQPSCAEHLVFVGSRAIKPSKAGTSAAGRVTAGLGALQRNRRCLLLSAVVAGAILWSANTFSGS